MKSIFITKAICSDATGMLRGLTYDSIILTDVIRHPKPREWELGHYEYYDEPSKPQQKEASQQDNVIKIRDD